MRAHAQSRVGVGVGDSEHNPLMVAPETLGFSHASRGTSTAGLVAQSPLLTLNNSAVEEHKQVCHREYMYVYTTLATDFSSK